MKCLLLHGFRQNESIFRGRSGALRSILKKYATSFEYLQGPVPLESENGGQETYGWYFRSPSEDERSNVDESAELVMNYVKEHDIEMVVGFSQGATLGLGLLHRMLRSAELPALKVVIMFSPYFPSSAAVAEGHPDFLSEMMADRDAGPTDRPMPRVMLVGGTGDQVVPVAGFQLIEEILGARGVEATTFMHEGGHFMPTNKDAKAQYIQFLGEQTK